MKEHDMKVYDFIKSCKPFCTVSTANVYMRDMLGIPDKQVYVRIVNRLIKAGLLIKNGVILTCIKKGK